MSGLSLGAGSLVLASFARTIESSQGIASVVDRQSCVRPVPNLPARQTPHRGFKRSLGVVMSERSSPGSSPREEKRRIRPVGARATFGTPGQHSLGRDESR